jgi:hypothetical protein
MPVLNKILAIFSLFGGGGGALPKECRNFFLNQAWQFIHQSIALVKFSQNMLFQIIFEMISGQKKF